MDTTTRQEPSGFLATAFNKVAAKIAVALIFSFSSAQAAELSDTAPPVPKSDTQDTAAPLAALKPSEIPMLTFSPPSAQIALLQKRKIADYKSAIKPSSTKNPPRRHRNQASAIHSPTTVIPAKAGIYESCR